jgi:hypothetical protein
MGQVIRGAHEVLRPAVRLEREAHEAREKILRDRRAMDLRWLMTSPQGRRIVARLMAEARIQAPVKTPEEIGARDHMLRFAAELIEHDHRLWLTMLEESLQDARNAGNAS